MFDAFIWIKETNTTLELFVSLTFSDAAEVKICSYLRTMEQCPKNISFVGIVIIT